MNTLFTAYMAKSRGKCFMFKETNLHELKKSIIARCYRSI